LKVLVTPIGGDALDLGDLWLLTSSGTLSLALDVLRVEFEALEHVFGGHVDSSL
jgi:hypothetical protein